MQTNDVDALTLAEMVLHNANVAEPTSDWMLRYLADQANLNDLRMSITLQLDGMLVSGILVGGQTYFNGITHDISAALDSSDESKAVANLFERVNQVVQASTNRDVPPPTPAYIHLKDARFFQPASARPIPDGQGVWWRGRLSQVSGFFFGSLSA